MSLGEDRVRVKFNPSATGLVDQIKQKTAELIDVCASIHPPVDYEGETRRLIALAQTHYEDAAMWAVKAATAGK
jgi:hypothetical protein